LDKLRQSLTQKSLSQRVTLVHGNYKDIKRIAQSHDFNSVSAVILDLGFSSSQLDDPSRGLSFQTEGLLDMRFSTDSERTAADIINKYSPEKLEKVFREYGEERLASKIVRSIVQHRNREKIISTKVLFEIIKESLPKPIVYKANDFARRIFQALRIEVNDELNNLRNALPDILEILALGGRMVII